MGKNVPQNLKRVEESLSGEEIKALNETSPGLGSKLHRLLSGLGSQLSAQSGYKGSVGLVKQKKKNPRGVVDAALTLQEDRVAGIADPIDDLDAVNLRTLRRMTRTEDEPAPFEDGNALKQVCRPVAMSNEKNVATGMTEIYAVEATLDFVYVLGLDDETGVLEIYSIHGDNVMTRVSRLELTEVPSRMVLQGHYIYACKGILFSSAFYAGDNLTIIDVKMPDTPVELTPFDTGATCNGIHAQGRFVYVAGNGQIAIIDVSVPGVPSIIGIAS